MPHKLDTIPNPHAGDATAEAQSLVQLLLPKENEKVRCLQRLLLRHTESK